MRWARYIANIRDRVQAAVRTESILSDGSKAALRVKIKELYPGRPLDAIIDMNVESLAAELALACLDGRRCTSSTLRPP